MVHQLFNSTQSVFLPLTFVVHQASSMASSVEMHVKPDFKYEEAAHAATDVIMSAFEWAMRARRRVCLAECLQVSKTSLAKCHSCSPRFERRTSASCVCIAHE